MAESLAFGLSDITYLEPGLEASRFSVRLFQRLQLPGSVRNAAGLVDALSISRSRIHGEEAVRVNEDQEKLVEFWLSHRLNISLAPARLPIPPDERFRTLKHLSFLLDIKLPSHADFPCFPSTLRCSDADSMGASCRARLGLSGLRNMQYWDSEQGNDTPIVPLSQVRSDDIPASLEFIGSATLARKGLIAEASALQRRNLLLLQRRRYGNSSRSINPLDVWRFVHLLAREAFYYTAHERTEEARPCLAEAAFILQAFRVKDWPWPDHYDATRGTEMIANIFFNHGVSLFYSQQYNQATSMFGEAVNFLKRLRETKADQVKLHDAQAAYATALHYSGDTIAACHAHHDLVTTPQQGPIIESWRIAPQLQDYGRTLEALRRYSEACATYGNAALLFLKEGLGSLRIGWESRACGQFHGLVKSLVLLGHCLIDDGNLPKAQSAYESTAALPLCLVATFPGLGGGFEEFNDGWKVHKELRGEFGQSCEDALESLRARVDGRLNVEAASIAGTPSGEAGKGKEVDDLDIVLRRIQLFCLTLDIYQPRVE